VRTSPLGGNYISNQIRSIFAESTPPVPLIPHYMVTSKTPVDAGQASQAIYKQFTTPPTPSFRAFEEDRVLTEFKESVVQVWEGPGRLNSGSQGTTNVDVVKNWPGRPFEMPDGWNQVFGADRFKPAEPLFDENAAIVDDFSPLKPKPEHTIPRLINSALMAVDADSRPLLLNHIVVVGGSSLLQGLTRRIDTEINAMFPGPRVRLHAPSATVERKYSSWIGGSILASLGSFHQNWISKKEYEEHGAVIIEQRCK
jgi:actin-related protein 4